jgi:hypothetical protein
MLVMSLVARDPSFGEERLLPMSKMRHFEPDPLKHGIKYRSLAIMQASLSWMFSPHACVSDKILG